MDVKDERQALEKMLLRIRQKILVQNSLLFKILTEIKSDKIKTNDKQ
jgi:hypothetical protein